MEKDRWILVGVIALVLVVGWGMWSNEKEQELEAPGATTETSERLAIRPASPQTVQSTTNSEEPEEIVEEVTEETVTEPTTETKNSEVESQDLVDNHSIELLQIQRDREAILAINQQFMDVYYGYDSVSERNEQLAEIMIESLAEGHALSEDEAVHEVLVENYAFTSYLGTIENEQADVLNVIEAKMDNIDVKMLVKVTYGFFNEWQITAVKFELIR